MRKLLCASMAASALMLAPAVAADLSVAPIYKAAPPAARGELDRLLYRNRGWRHLGERGRAQRHDRPRPDPAVRSQRRDRRRHHRAQVQNGNLVIGYEGDTSITSKKGSAAEFPPNAGFSNEVRERWLSTFRGRVGVTQDNWLFYATAGGALASIEHTITSPAGTQISERNWHWGWTAGAGVEVKISPDWSAKMEYLYVGLQDKSYFNPAPARLSRATSGAPRRSHRARRRELQAALERARHLLQALTRSIFRKSRNRFSVRKVRPTKAARPHSASTERGQRARSIQTGTWSDGFSQPRTCLSMPAPTSRSAACGDSSRWSMRMPSFFCQAPA